MNKHSDNNFIVKILLFGFALAGILGLLWATSRGIGLSPDSARYIDCAKNITKGKGYSTSLQDYYQKISIKDYLREIQVYREPLVRPEVHYPPLYSYGIAFLARLGLDAIKAAQGISILLFGINIFLVGYIVSKFSRNRLLLSFGAGALMFGSESMLEVHTMALSEPLFIFLSLVGFLVLSKYLWDEKLSWLAIAAGVFGLAFLTRIMGGALIVTGVIGIALFGPKILKKKLLAISLFTFISSIPMVIHIIRNIQVTGILTTRQPSNNLLGFNLVSTLISWFSSWLFPGSSRIIVVPFQQLITSFFVVIVASVLMIACIGFYLKHKREVRAKLFHSNCEKAPFLFAIHLLVYLFLFIIATKFIDIKLLTEPRLLSPIFISCLVVCLFLVDQIFHRPRTNTFLNKAMVAYFIYYALSGMVWMHYCHNQGRGYFSREWQSEDIISPLMRLQNDMKSIAILSNDDSAVYFICNRYAYGFPIEEIGNDSNELELKDENSQIYFVYFKLKQHKSERNAVLWLAPDKFEQSLNQIVPFPVDVVVNNTRLTVFRKKMKVVLR